MDRELLGCRELDIEKLNFVKEQWQGQIEALDGSIDDLSSPYLSHAEKLIENPEGNSKVYALVDKDGFYKAIFHAHSKPIKGHSGITMRVPWVNASPVFDINEPELTEVAQLSGSLLTQSISLSRGDLKADHLKIHMNGSIDRRFMMGLVYNFNSDEFNFKVDFAGSWLHIEYID
ncbi:hypothetical protein [Terasakiella pusilla]|uniref:hypothetical protein n=1 Tax=Terasakiella pusilla TaxID=64973 RepID=UPI003AA83371